MSIRTFASVKIERRGVDNHIVEQAPRFSQNPFIGRTGKQLSHRARLAAGKQVKSAGSSRNRVLEAHLATQDFG